MNERPDQTYNDWFVSQVKSALEQKAKHGDRDYKPWRDVMAKFGILNKKL